MAETLFPTRQRCKACAKSLGAKAAPVYKGLFCTPRCAGMAPPASDAGSAPRECRTHRDGKDVFKRRWRSMGEVPDKLKDDPSSSFYVCSHCGHWHTGHSRMGTAESLRVLHTDADIGDTLVKLRGSATRAQVAKVAGIRPVRLKELEEGSRGTPADHFDLLRVARALGCGIAFTIPAGRL